MDTAVNWEAYARKALPEFDLDESTPLTLLNISENATFRIDAPGAKSVLRVHRTDYHSREAIESELAWVSALRDQAIVRTPAFLPTASGESVAVGRLGDGDERYVCRFEWVDGVEPSEDRLVQDFEQLGAITARLHEHSRHWGRPPGFTRFTWDFDTALGDHGHWGSWKDGLGMDAEALGILELCSQKLKTRLERWGKSDDKWGLVHADMRLANLLVDEDAVAVIDFDDCGLSWFMYDLGSSLSFIEHEPYVPELVDSWVRGYRTVAPLSSAEEQELRTFIMFRRMLLVAWVGSHSSTETAQAMGVQYTLDSCRLAEEYLSFNFMDD